MALDPPKAWEDRLRQMAQSQSLPAGAKELADFYGDLGDKVQGGPAGAPGIFTFNRAVFAAQLIAIGYSPTLPAPAWAAILSTAWLNAVNASTIKPGTVANPAWTASGVDVNTIPIGSATIITAAAAAALLQANLIASAAAFKSNPDDGIFKFAKAFHDATKQFTFLTIGLVATPAPVPLPIPTGAS